MNIAVLISGGVDSSVALRLLQEQGHTVTAFYLKIWLEDELSFLGSCPWEDDLSYVRAVCEDAQVPLEVVSLQKEYHEHVVAYTIAQVKAGKTPNPDIFCNQRIKFGLFLEYIDTLYPGKFDKIASGHYAQVELVGDTYRLVQAPDPVKDQTYFLSYLSQKQLSRLIFPIGHLNKPQVRELAQKFNLPNKERKDSQGICFLGTIKFSDFVGHYLGEQIGNLVELETGTIWGQHKGFWYYTIGQRQGLRLAGGPWYVVQKDMHTNTVYISRNYYAPEKQRDTFVVNACNWIAGTMPTTFTLRVKLRHGAQFNECVLTPLADDCMQVKLAQRDQGIAAGQFAVFYDGGTCLGSGIIL